MNLDSKPRVYIHATQAADPLGAQRPMHPAQIASIIICHLLPVAATLWFHWSVAQFALLAVLNIVFTIMGGFTGNMFVSMLKAPPRAGLSLWGRIQPWVSLFVTVTIFICLLTAMFGGVILAIVPDGTLADRRLRISAVMMLVGALPGLIAQARADARSGLSEEARFARARPAVLLQVASGFAMLIFSTYAVQWFGGFALYPLMFGITAFFIFRDLRPDVILRQFFPGY